MSQIAFPQASQVLNADFYLVNKLFLSLSRSPLVILEIGSPLGFPILMPQLGIK